MSWTALVTNLQLTVDSWQSTGQCKRNYAAASARAPSKHNGNKYLIYIYLYSMQCFEEDYGLTLCKWAVKMPPCSHFGKIVGPPLVPFWPPLIKMAPCWPKRPPWKLGPFWILEPKRLFSFYCTEENILPTHSVHQHYSNIAPAALGGSTFWFGRLGFQRTFQFVTDWAFGFPSNPASVLMLVFMKSSFREVFSAFGRPGVRKCWLRINFWWN